MINFDEGVVIPVDKPRGWSSFQAVGKVRAVIRNTYGIKKFKIGHAGALDPLASGLLIVCIGRATKKIPLIQDCEKVYTGTMVFGATTPCYDLERAIDAYHPFEHITLQSVEEAVKQFVGTIEQVPPTFSAVKIAGQRAYKYARLDDPTAVIEPKKVTVYSFEITDFQPASTTQDNLPPIIQQPADAPQTGLYKNPQGVLPEGLPQIKFRITCGKGTYIRSLARDLGVALGSGAVLSDLRRERVGEYTVDKAAKMENLADFITF